MKKIKDIKIEILTPKKMVTLFGGKILAKGNQDMMAIIRSM